MLPQMHFQVASGIILFVAAFVLTFELVEVVVGTLVISENPLLPEFALASLEATFVLGDVGLVVSSHVIGQMLRHLEWLCTSFERTFVLSHRHMSIYVLAKFRVLWEHSFAGCKHTCNILLDDVIFHAQLDVPIEVLSLFLGYLVQWWCVRIRAFIFVQGFKLWSLSIWNIKHDVKTVKICISILNFNKMKFHALFLLFDRWLNVPDIVKKQEINLVIGEPL